MQIGWIYAYNNLKQFSGWVSRPKRCLDILFQKGFIVKIKVNVRPFFGVPHSTFLYCMRFLEEK